VVLLRDGDDGVEAYLLRRLAALEFAGGMYVFPGGSVDQRDADTAIGWVGPQPDEWAPALDADLPLARALVCAAVRETFEESGVLLAGADDTDVVALASNVEHWAGEQAALLDRSASMADVLARNGLVLRTDLLRPWAHWTTPEIEPKRFDTRFFVAALPAHQEPLAHTAEAEHGGWRRPAEALQAHAAGELGMLPPTAFTLAELAEYGTVDEVLAAATSRDIRRVLPKIVVTGDEVSFLLPGDAGYPGG
jgi:8-oxo-dGTP pyrophosphatase MutT (NUDIX family)